MVLAVLLAAALVAAPAAPATVPAPHEQFKQYFAQGEALFQKGEYGAAIWNFRKADRIKLTPEVAYDLAKCHEKLGDHAYATYYYRLYLRRAPNATDALGVAERVGTVLSQAQVSGRGLLEVDSTSPGPATINGHRFIEFPVALLLPPGDYELAAQFPDGVKRRQVSIRTGKVTAVQFEPMPPPLVSADGAPAPVVVSSASLLPQPSVRSRENLDLVEPAPARRSPLLRTAAYVSLGVSAAALLGGVAFGMLARGDGSRLETEHGALTTTEAQGLARSANGRGQTANILFGVGAVTGVAGGALYLLSSPQDPGVD